MGNYDHLTIALEDWFDKPLSDIPDNIRQRIEKDMFPLPWDSLSPEQRRIGALQLDYQHDPATEKDRQYWWDFFCQKEALKNQIQEWEKTATPTASDLTHKEGKLKELRAELRRMNEQERQPQRPYIPGQKAAKADAPNYIAYPKAMKLLSERWNATPEELAAWLFMGPEDGGIAAYTNANELDPPPRFFYGYHTGAEDFIAPLMACWFKEKDIAHFQPVDRYISGQALIERWAQHTGILPAAFIRAKIAESRLMDMHPTFGMTAVSFPKHEGFPPLESGLFSMSQVTAIEEMDGIIPVTLRPDGSEDSETRKRRLQARIAELKSKKVKGFLQTVATEEGVSVTRIKQIINDKAKLPPSPAKMLDSPWAGLATSKRQPSQKKSKNQ